MKMRVRAITGSLLFVPHHCGGAHRQRFADGFPTCHELRNRLQHDEGEGVVDDHGRRGAGSERGVPGDRDGRRGGRGQLSRRHVRRDAVLDDGVGDAGQHRDPRAFARRVGEHLPVLIRAAELDRCHGQEQQQRQRHRHFNQRRAALAADSGGCRRDVRIRIQIGHTHHREAVKMAPTAIAGAYAKRFRTAGSSSAVAYFPPVMTRSEVPLRVSATRPRMAATLSARTAPAIAVCTSAGTINDGPRNAPTAANSLTSPPPVAPIRYPGSINRRPTPHPASAAPMPTVPQPAAASSTPDAASGMVNALGMRRVRRSIAAAAHVAAATIARTRVSEFMVAGKMRDGPLRGPSRVRYGAAGTLILVATSANTFFTLVPVAVTATTATRAIRPTSRAYSSRSWPASSLASARIRVIRFMTFFSARVTATRGVYVGNRCAAAVYGAAGTLIFVATSLNTSFTLVPVAVTATTATRAIRPTSRAYSSRSWPASSLASARIRLIRFMTFLRARHGEDRKSTRLNSSHSQNS